MKIQLIAFIFCCTTTLIAHPKKATVKAGKPTMVENGPILEIHVPNKSVIDWESFSIQPHETTRFSMPSKDVAVLNRVTGKETSQLMGQLSANGRVYLVNPNGVVIGKDAIINTASFIVSTLDIEIEEFLGRGDLHFLSDRFGVIENYGTILSATGPVVLLAHTVRNYGTIDAPHISIGAGSEFLVQPTGETEVFIRPQSTSHIDHEGQMSALIVQLQTDGAMAPAINQNGVIHAERVVKKDGRIFLLAQPTRMAELSAGPPVTFVLAGSTMALSSSADADIQTSLVLTGTGSFSLTAGADLNVDSDVTANNINLTLQAGNNLQISDSITSVNGDQLLKAGVNVRASLPVSITTTGTGSLTIVADNLFPSAPRVGSGLVDIAAASTMTTNGGLLTIYSGYDTVHNVFPTTINGALSPGSPIIGIYYPDGSGGIPFQIFFKLLSATPFPIISIASSLANTLPSENTNEDPIEKAGGLPTQSAAPCQGLR